MARTAFELDSGRRCGNGAWHAGMAAKVFIIANQKGGVGKTTTAVNLAAGLAEKRVRSLILDLDPQSNATSSLGYEKEEGGSILGPLMGEGSAEERVKETRIKNLYLIPAEPDLATLEAELPRRENYLVQLRQVLEPLKNSDRFDTIIIDCPPSLGMISMNALGAADYLLVALQCEYLAMEGLGQILEVSEQLKSAGVNPNLEVGGIVMTMYDVRTNLCQQVDTEVRKHFSEKVFKTIIPRTIRLGEAPSFGQTIFEYDGVSSGAVAYRNLAKEVAKRFSLGRK